MTILTYDGRLDGLLTAIFEVYEYRIHDASIKKETEASYSLFGQTKKIITDKAKAERVWSKLKERLSNRSLSQFYKSFLSELPGIEDHMLGYVRYILSSKMNVENNYAHRDVLMLHETSRKVHREKHRMEAFVRFQLTKDGLYYSIIQPDYDVLPLIRKHFRDRYADQRWMIYDARRKYGIYYDLKDLSEVQMDFAVDVNNRQELAAIYDEKEELWQSLWQQYFSSVNIPARKNMKLHVKHMPKRYWKHLPEKMGIQSQNSKFKI